VVVLVAEFERGAAGGIAEGLHAADQLIRTESRVVGTALLQGVSVPFLHCVSNWHKPSSVKQEPTEAAMREADHA
jgi:hypothetical protein